MNWLARLEFTPITTPDGKTLRTLKDAEAYMLAIPANEVTAQWVHAAKAVRKAAEVPNQLYRLCARIAVYKAIYGDVEPVRVRKETWLDKRKRARQS